MDRKARLTTRLKPLRIALFLAGYFGCLPLALAAGITAATSSGESRHPVNVGEVSRSTKHIMTEKERQLKTSNTLLTKNKVFKSTQSELFLGKKNKHYVSPVGGAAQLLTMAPGVHIMSQNPATGAGRDTITINGMGIGWWSGITYKKSDHGFV